MPIKVKAENVFVKMIFSSAIANDKAGVNQAIADLILRVAVRTQAGELYESDVMAVGIEQRKPRIRRGLNFVTGDAAGREVISHLRNA